MADLKKSIKDEMNSTPSCIPAKWNRFTVADGDWMQAKTIDQLMNRDDFLADKIGESNSAWQDALSSESATRYSDDQYLSASLTALSGEFASFSANEFTKVSGDLYKEIDRAKNAENTLTIKLNNEAATRSATDADLYSQIDKLKAATDVIAVFGTHEEFIDATEDTEWMSQVTDNDTIKVLKDDDDYQVYYEWHDSKHTSPDWVGWSAIGSLDPYYSVSEIDEYLEQIDDEFDNLTYVNKISASDTEIGFDFHKGAGNQTTFKIKQGPNIAFTSGVNELTISALPGTKSYNIDDSQNTNNMFWGEDMYNPAFDFLAGEAGDWSTMNEIIDCFNNNIPVYINEFNAASEVDSSNYVWKLNTIKTFTADDRPHIKFTFENEHEETNFYGVIDWKDGDHGIVVNSYSGISKSTLLHDTNLSGDGSPTSELGLNSAVNVYVPLVQDQKYSANVQIGYTPNDLYFNGYLTDHVGVALNRNYQGLNDTFGFQLDEFGLHLNSRYSPDGSTITSYATQFTYNEYFTLNSAYWNTHYKNITAFDKNGSEEPIRLNELKLSAGKGLSFTMTDRSQWSPAATWRYPGTTWNNASGYTKLALSVDDSIISSAEHGQEAYETLTAAKISANSSPSFTGLLSNGFRISAGNNLTITTTSNNTIQLNAKDTGLTSISAGGNINQTATYNSNLKLSAGDGIKFITTSNNLLGISAGGAKYTAGNSISINNSNEISLSSEIIVDKIDMSDGGTINFADNDHNKAYLNKNSLDFSAEVPSQIVSDGIYSAHYGYNYLYFRADGRPNKEVVYDVDSISGNNGSLTYNFKLEQVATAIKLTAGNGISIGPNYAGDPALNINMTAIKANSARIDNTRITTDYTVTSLYFKPDYLGGVTTTYSWIGVSSNGSELGILAPKPSQLTDYSNNARMLIQHGGNNSNSQVYWEDVSSVMKINGSRYISGNGTITAMVTATQPGSNANVLYLI